MTKEDIAVYSEKKEFITMIISQGKDILDVTIFNGVIIKSIKIDEVT